MAEGDCENYICKCHNKNVEKKIFKKCVNAKINMPVLHS